MEILIHDVKDIEVKKLKEFNVDFQSKEKTYCLEIIIKTKKGGLKELTLFSDDERNLLI